jgi:hypothetical protein
VLSRLFLRLSSSSRKVCRRFGVAREDFLPRKYTRVFLFLSLCRGIIIIHPPARYLRRYFLFSLSRRQQTDKNGIKVVPFFTALSLSARARAHPEREREFDRTSHTQNTHIFLSSLCGDRDELNGLLFIGAFFCLFRRRREQQQQQREKKRKRISRGWRQLQR